MAERLYRIQILLEPEQHRVLREIAQREGRSVSDLVRAMIREQLERRQPDEELRRQLDALDRIRAHREELLRKLGKPLNIDVAEWINQGREERDEAILPDLDRR